MLGGSRHDPMRRPVVDPRRLGSGVDRRTVAAGPQHGERGLDGLRGRAGGNQLRCKLRISPRRLSLRRAVHRLCRAGCADARCCACFPCAGCRRPLVGATGVTTRFASCHEGWAIDPLVTAAAVTERGRRAGLSPSATSIRVLTATAVSMIAGKIPRGVPAVPDGQHQITQRHEAHRERAHTDDRHSADRPAVDPSRRVRTDGGAITVRRRTNAGQIQIGPDKHRSCAKLALGATRAPRSVERWGDVGVSRGCESMH